MSDEQEAKEATQHAAEGWSHDTERDTMKVTKKPAMRQYEVLLSEEDLREYMATIHGRSTIHVSHVDTAPNADDFLVRICVTEMEQS